MSSNKFASFAPYTPPPDDPSYAPIAAPISKAAARPWFPAHPSSSNAIDVSYQSGAIPTFGTSAAGGSGAAEEAEGQQNQWETRYGMRVDVLAAIAYLFGPISALALLIIETQNDYVRFHAYQSALLTMPLVLLRIFASLLHFPPWMRTFFTLCIIFPQLYMAFQAYRDASRTGLVHYHLPVTGPIAEQWLQDE